MAEEEAVKESEDEDEAKMEEEKQARRWRR